MEDNLVDEVVTLGKEMGLEVDEDDVEDLVVEHEQELTTDELLQLENEQVRNLEEHFSSTDDEETITTTADAKKLCALWRDLQEGIEKHHPDKTLSSRAMDYMNDHVMSHFRKVIEKNKKQSTIDKFFQKRTTTTEPSTQQQEGFSSHQ